MTARGSFVARLRRGADAALMRGPGYEPVPLGARFDDTAVRGYYLDYSSKTLAPGGREGDPALPTPAIQLALGWWERHMAGDTAAREAFLEATAAVERRAERVGEALVWPIGVPVAKYGLRPPWRSVLPQAQAASVFLRAHVATGDDRFGELAIAAARPLLADGESDLVTRTANGPVLEEAPSTPHSHILNGWISGLWSLWELSVALEHAPAGAAFDAGLRCLRASLEAYDTGWWTRYSLYPSPLADLAKPIYHRLHVDQVEALHRLTGDAVLKAVRERWSGYDRGVNRARAIAQKAAYSAVEGPRRRRWQRRQPIHDRSRSGSS